MILKQYYLGCLAQASYLIGDEETGRAAMVDPRRDVEEFLDDARELGLSIDHVFLTHFHADFIAGHLELAKVTGAKIHLGARAEADFAFVPMPDGAAIDLGRVRLKVLETPGHTPESICLAVYDTEADPLTPRAVLTGDTLFIGDVGRPDLMASIGVTAVELAGQLYDSLWTKLLPLPGQTLVYPAHGAGSMCGKNLSEATVSTIGEQRRTNYALKRMSKEEFVRLVTEDQPDAPAYFAYDATLNRRQRPTLDESLALALVPLGVGELLRLQADGATVLDARDADHHAASHLRGSVNIGLGGSYAVWAGTLLDRERPIVIVADRGHEHEAALRLGRIGFDRVAGFLDGVPAALKAGAEHNRSVRRLTPSDLASRSDVLLLDIRSQRERDERRIEGSLHIPLNRLPERIEEIPKGKDLVLYCRSGYRSSIGASLLRARGRESATDLMGGIDLWEAFGLETAGSH